MILFKNKHGEIRAGWALALIMAIYYASWFCVAELTQAIASLAVKIGGSPDLGNQILAAVFGTALFRVLAGALMIGLLWLMFKLVYNRPFVQIGLYKAGFLKQMGFGLLFGIAVASLVVLILLAVGAAQLTELNLANIFTPAVWNVFVIFLSVGIYEEILTRGAMMTVLKTTRNKWLIVLVPSAIFGLIHLFNHNIALLPVINIALFGVLFSYLFAKTGRLWAPIGLHITWNLFTGIIYGMPVSGSSFASLAIIELTGSKWLTGGAFGVEGGVLCTLVVVLGLAYVHFFVKQAEGFWGFDSGLPLVRGGGND
ncbi:MAG: CPBP family intramembrane metalloprotease [Defluviitaleaceae bacterium]|nr:CPBP family intramembrane metalloprotease [Defluviitaleaceae bacterium]